MRARTLIVLGTTAVVYSSSMFGIMANTSSQHSKPVVEQQTQKIVKIESTTKPDEKAITDIETTEVLTTEETSINAETETTKKKKKTKETSKKNQKPTTKKIIASNPTTRKHIISTTKPKHTNPPTKSLGYYSESNAMSSGKVNIIRNSVNSVVGGARDSEMQSLARYLSARGSSSASGTYRALTGKQKSISAKTCSVTMESDSQDNVLKAASSAASKIGGVSGSRVGIGVSTFRFGNGFRAFVVVTYY